MIGVPCIEVVLLAATIRLLHGSVFYRSTTKSTSVPRKDIIGVDTGSIHGANAAAMEECRGIVACHGHSVTNLYRGKNNFLDVSDSQTMFEILHPVWSCHTQADR